VRIVSMHFPSRSVAVSISVLPSWSNPAEARAGQQNDQGTRA
jgi:hypothetical protein